VLVVTRTGVGKVAVAPYDLAISQDITGLVVRQEIIRSDFLYWWLVTYSSKLKQKRQGTSINGILREDLEELRLVLPPRNLQQKIAESLGAIDTVIERTEAVIKAIRKLREIVIQEVLTYGVPGWHKEWKHAPGIGNIPTCWSVVRLEQVADIQTGRAVGKPAGPASLLTLPYLSVANVKDGYLDLSVVKTMQVTDEELRRFSLREGDVLFTEGGTQTSWGAAACGTLRLIPVFTKTIYLRLGP